MGRIVTTATTALALAAAVAGCGGGSRSDAVPAAPAPPSTVARAPAPSPAPPVVEVAAPVLRVPPGFRARRVPDAGAQVAVPAGWIALTRLDSLFPGTIQTLGGIDRRVVGPLAALGVPDSPLKLLVLAPVRDGRFAATISLVVASQHDAPAFERWVSEAVAAVVARSQVRGTVASSRVLLPVGRGVRLRFHRTSGGAPAASVVYLALGGGKVYYLALTARRHEAWLTRPFDVLARSLTLLPGAVPVSRPTMGTARAA